VLGADVRRLTDAERARTATRAQCYRVVGHSQWCPGWSFAGRLDALEQELAVMRAAAHMVAGDAEELAEAECSTGPSVEDTVGCREWTKKDEPCGEWPAWGNSIVSGEADPS